MATVTLPAPLRALAGGNREIPLAGLTVLRALQSVGREYPRLRRHLLTRWGGLRPLWVVFLDGRRLRFPALRRLSPAAHLQLVPSPRGGNWLISYSDFITLLFVFFVVLYSMAATNTAKLKTVVENLARAVAGLKSLEVVSPSISLGGALDKGDPVPIIIAELPPRPPETVDMLTDMAAQLREAGVSGDVSLQANVESTLVAFNDKLLFKPGTAEFEPSAVEALQTMLEFLQNSEKEVRVIGHTDSSATDPAQFATNWELSGARAVTIVRWFVDMGSIQPKRLVAVAQAEFRPLFPNDTEEHMKKNRRSEIIIINPTEKKATMSVGAVGSIEKIPELP